MWVWRGDQEADESRHDLGWGQTGSEAYLTETRAVCGRRVVGGASLHSWAPGDTDLRCVHVLDRTIALKRVSVSGDS